MHKTLAVLALATFSALASSPAAASDKTDAMAPVRQFADGLNKGDMKSALAACADESSIIDDFAPHEWHGAGACGKWANDFGADAQKKGLTDGIVTLGKPRHVDVTGDRAYVVVPATFAYKLKGKPVKEPASLLTVALQKGPGGWRMVAWTWSKH